MKNVFTFCLLLTCLFSFDQQEIPKTKLKPIFNGKDLKGWYSFFSSKGKDNDIEKVFAVENGVLHISGKEFGYICTEKSYKDFHLAVEFKWGTNRFPPRENDKRDNGILFFVPEDAADRVWPKSVECQIQEGDVGDFWLIDNATIYVDGKQTIPGDFVRVEKKKDAEKPTGEWNRVEVVANKGKIIYYVNGVQVNQGENPNLTEGKIIIQSEGAEIYYRLIEIARLK